MVSIIKTLTRTLHGKLFTQPLPPADSFKGQRVLITGGTAGLGLAAAVNVLRLGAESVVITCRDAARGEAAKKRIEAAAGAAAAGRVSVAQLDMSVFSSVAAFAEQLKRDHGADGGFDFVCLNAGVNDPSFKQGPEGWQTTMQVNTLSTLLLAQLLLPWMKELRAHRKAPAHLTIVSSGMHLGHDVSRWPELADKSGGILHHFNKKENFPGGQTIYGITKLWVQYGLVELASAALGPDGRPEVIVNSCCPGMVRTEISRTMKEESLLVRLAEPIVLPLLGQTPEVGSRTYLAAGLTTEEGHGKFITAYMTEAEWVQESRPSLTTETGRKVQKMVWNEIQQELTTKVPTLKQIWVYPTA